LPLANPVVITDGPVIASWDTAAGRSVRLSYSVHHCGRRRFSGQDEVVRLMSARRLSCGAERFCGRVGLTGCLALLVSAWFAGSVSAAGFTAYVTSGDQYSATAAATPFSTATGAAGTPVPVPLWPIALAVAPNAKTVYVVNSGYSGAASGVTPISTTTNTAAPAIPIDGGRHIAITPDGRTTYITGTFAGPPSFATGVTHIALPSGTPRLIPLLADSSGIAITPDGKTAYVASGNDVVPIDLATNTREAPIALGNPLQIAITPSGTTAYVTGWTGAGDVVTPIDIATNTPGAAIPISGLNCSDAAIAITPDGTTAYASNPCSGLVTPISLETNAPGSPIPVSGAYNIVITPDGKTGYVTGNAGVVPIDIATNTPGAPLAVGTGAIAVAIAPLALQGRPTSTSLTCSPTTALLGHTTSCRVTATDTGSGTPVTPTGIVTVKTSGPFSFSACTLSGTGASASCQVSYAPTSYGSGQATLVAGYAGDSHTHAASTGHTTLTVAGGTPTSTAVSCAPGALLVGQSTVCTATVSDASATPTGTVTFATDKSGTFTAKSCTLAGSSATCQVSYTPTGVGGGQHTITARYLGDAIHAPSAGQYAVAVSIRSSTTTLNCQQTMVAVGQTTICTVTVLDASPPPAVTPTGTVTLAGSNSDSFTGSPCTLSGSSGAASCQVTYTPLAVGAAQHTISAYYGGDRAHHSSHGQTTLTVTSSAR
jgi:DNA-binding beta-propeller fold protein YncE